MIFNETVLKKMMKTEYKGHGLLVANKEGRIILGGSWWVISMDEEVFTKRAKASLVELTGCLPEQGECFRVTSAGCQMEIPHGYMDIDGKKDMIIQKKTCIKTDILIDSFNLVRVFRKEDQMFFINELVSQLLEPSCLTEREEGYIEGPLYEAGGCYWFNPYNSLMVLPVEDETLEEKLKEVTF